MEAHAPFLPAATGPPPTRWAAALLSAAAVVLAGAALYAPASGDAAAALWAPTTVQPQVATVPLTTVPPVPRAAGHLSAAHPALRDLLPEPLSPEASAVGAVAGLDLTWGLSCLIGAGFAYWVGRAVGQAFAPAPSIAMWSTSGQADDRRSEWDKRVSLMDQVQASQELKYISEQDFSKLVIKFLQQRYGEKETDRVVASWYRTERGEDFRKVWSTHPLMVQEATSYIEGLASIPNWPEPAKHHPWMAALQEGWPTIRAELEEAIKLGDEGLKAKGSISWMGAQGGGDAYGPGWKTLGLCDRGYWDEDNTRLFKNTCRILRKSRAPIMECFFAKMPAGAVIKPHSDNTNFVLTAHLGLICPPGKSWINVGDARNEWKDGEVMLMDTTYLHEAFNTSDQDRYILLLRVWHPDLTRTEIEAITFLFDCLDDSDIILHPDGMAMYDMMKAHRMMEWNAILGPGDTEEESEEILRRVAAGEMNPDLQEAAKMAEQVNQKLKEGGPQ